MMYTHIAGRDIKCSSCKKAIVRGTCCFRVFFNYGGWSRHVNLCEKCLLEHAHAVHLHNALHSMSAHSTP